MRDEVVKGGTADRETGRQGAAARATLARAALLALCVAFAGWDPPHNAWAAVALVAVLGLDGLASAAARRADEGRDALTPVPDLPSTIRRSVVLAFSPEALYGVAAFAAAMLACPARFPLLASALAGLIAIGAVARLALAWIVRHTAQAPDPDA